MLIILRRHENGYKDVCDPTSHVVRQDKLFRDWEWVRGWPCEASYTFAIVSPVLH